MSVAFIFPLIFLLSWTFPHNDLKIKRVFLVLTVLSMFFIQVLSLTDLIFSGVNVENGVAVPVPGKLIPLYGLYVLSYLIVSTIVLFRKIASGLPST